MTAPTLGLPHRYAQPRLVGRGGMADVFVAEDRELRRPVAIKILRERPLDDDAFRARFRREALTAARLGSHPHIAVVHDVGESHDRPYIVMEAHAAGSVADALRRGPVELRTALAWLEQAADALDYAHAAGVVHRDVKSANLLVDERGEVQVSDFGIALVGEESTALTSAGAILGTPGYLAPEQLRGEPATPASDGYALAVVAFELLTGERPFARGTPAEEIGANLHAEPADASSRRPGLGPAVDAVLHRGLAKEPAERHPSAWAFVDDLRTALTSGGRDDAATTPIRRRAGRFRRPPVGATANRVDGASPHDAHGRARRPVAAEANARAPRASGEAVPYREPPPPVAARQALWVSRSLVVVMIVAGTLIGGAVGFAYALSLLVAGLLVGALARLVRPGYTPIGGSATAALGAAAMLGVGFALHGRSGTVVSFALAVVAAVVLIELWWRFWRAWSRRRATEPARG